MCRFCNKIFIFTSATGTCLPIWGKKQGEHCYNDNDCESGFLCMGSGAKRTCQTPTPGDKVLGKIITFLYILSYHQSKDIATNGLKQLKGPRIISFECSNQPSILINCKTLTTSPNALLPFLMLNASCVCYCSRHRVTNPI